MTSLLQSESVCDTCDGLGVVLMRSTSTDGFETVPCPSQNCEAGNERRSLMFRKAIKEAEIPPLYQPMTFDSFAAALKGKNGEGKELAYAAARMLAAKRGQSFTMREAARKFGAEWFNPMSDHETSSLVLTGDVGMGKTGLVVACANELVANGVSVLYVRVTDLIDSLQATYSREYVGPSMDQKLLALITVPVLILDEFEIQNYTSDRLELIERVIRGRHGRNRPFVATTNIESPEQFSRLWDRRIGDIVATAHWVRVHGHKMRHTSAGVHE